MSSDKLNQKISSGIGRRKSAVALVRLVPGTGNIQINNKLGLDYLQLNLSYLNICKSPLELSGLGESYDILVKVSGGGLNGQAEAIRLAVARALCGVNQSYRAALKDNCFLKRDSRIKERKKYGLKKARKASQYSKR